MPAPIGNTFALGNSGLSKQFSSPEELKQYIDQYFVECDNNPIIKQDFIKSGEMAGEIIDLKTQRPYTVEGLCIHLGIDRKTLLNYQKRKGYEEFFHVISQAKRRITDQYVSLGLSGGYNASLVKFLLSNNTEYKDKVEVDNRGEMKVKFFEEKTYSTEETPEKEYDETDDE